MPNSDSRPLRSPLYMPASNRRAIAKARTLDCDAVILDLEDAVAPEAKAEARTIACEEAHGGGFGHRRLIARINALDSEWGADDLAALASPPIEALLAPKIATSEDVAALSRAMDAAGYRA
jgi:citrate lyase subunit beta/citryl-CoA lyase